MYKLFVNTINHFAPNTLYGFIEEGSMAMVKCLLTKDNVNDYHSSGFNPLSFALYNKKFEIIIYLLELLGADPTKARNSKSSILEFYITRGNDSFITLLTLYAPNLDPTHLAIDNTLKQRKQQLDANLKLLEEHGESHSTDYLSMLNICKKIGDVWWDCAAEEPIPELEKHYQLKSLQAYTEAAKYYQLCKHNKIAEELLKQYADIFNRQAELVSLIGDVNQLDSLKPLIPHNKNAEAQSTQSLIAPSAEIKLVKN